MKKMCLFLLVLVFLSSCQKEKEEILVWNGNTNLGGANYGEAISILWMEPVSGISSLRYPLKAVSDVEQIREIINHLNSPKNPGQYVFSSRRYLLVCFVQRDMKAVSAIRIQFLIENGDFICPTGKDNDMYSILMSAVERENYYGDPKLVEQIINSDAYKEFWNSQLTREPNIIEQ